MLTWLKSILKAPLFDDENKTRAAGLLYVILLSFFGLTTLMTTLMFALNGLPANRDEAFTMASGIVMAGLSLVLLRLVRRGYVRGPSLALTFCLWGIISFWIWTSTGIGADTSFFTYPLIIALAGLLAGEWAGIGFTALCSSVMAAVYFAEINGLVEYGPRTPNIFDLFIALAGLTLTGLLIRHAVRRTAEGFDRAQRHKRELESSNRELQASRASLEQHSSQLQAAVQRYVDFMTEVGQGNLSSRLTIEAGSGQDDPLVVLGHNLNETVANLQEMITRTRTTAANLASSAAAILAATAQQTTGASEQSAAIAQASGTIGQVRTIAEQAAQRAQSVTDLAQRTTEVSQAGQQAVADTVAGMEQVKGKVESIADEILALSQQTETIGEIITTVNEIATQSNLLALNAAVEAARAGQAGRGFAIVAQEMRSLAEQSQEATEQVRDILSEIQRSVHAAVMATEEGMKGADVGMKLAGESGLAIQKLAESVTMSMQAAMQTSAAAGQQVTGMQQIAQAMEHIHQVTAQSVAGAQQVERAAEELNNLSGQLRGLVEQYQS